MAEEIKQEEENNEEKPLKNRKEIERDDKGRILPGQEALNPAGRPKGGFSLVELLKKELQVLLPKIKDEEERKTVAAAFIQIALEKAMVRGDVTMIRDIFNRVDGMPKQSLEHTGEDGGAIQINIVNYKDAGERVLTPDELAAEKLKNGMTTSETP